MSPVWSFVLAGVGAAGLFIAATRPKVGYWFNLGAQVIWLVYGIVTMQWGFILSVGMYGFVFTRLLVRAYRPVEPTESKE